MIAPAGFQDFETLRHCPICGSEDRKSAFPPDVERCEKCRCYFRNPRPTQADIQRSYDYGANYQLWAQIDPESRRGMWERRLERVLAVARPGGSLLDVGAGDGYFLDLAKRAGFATAGTELSATGAAFARERGHDILLGQVTDIDFAGRSFDVVTLWHVLEHLPNPGEALECVRRLLPPGGIFALAVPNEENRLFRYRCGVLKSANPLDLLGWGGEIHLSHFQPATLSKVLREAGFEILQFGVDDIYHDRRPKNLAKLALQKMLNAVFGWHFSMAMYFVCRRR